MSSINPDPHAEGYVYEPTHAVTAEFPSGIDVAVLETALAKAGFESKEVQLFQGAAGVERLDLHGDRHGGWVHFRRAVQRVFVDEIEDLEEIEETLRSGGVVAVAFTAGDAARKEHAIELFKAHGGQALRYWGDWTIDRI